MMPQVHYGTDDGAGTTHKGSREGCTHPSCEATAAKAERITEAIAVALREADAPGVIALLKLLAVTDPVQAQAVYDTIELGLALNGTSVADGMMKA